MHPTQAQFQRMLHILWAGVKAGSNCKLDMISTHSYITSKNEVCGTIFCHGGFYALGLVATGQIKSVNIDWNDGAYQMSRELGFDSREELMAWAESNPELWGNGDGWGIFNCHLAFTPGRKTYSDTIDDIYNHWVEVALRCLILDLHDEEPIYELSATEELEQDSELEIELTWTK